MTRSVAEPRQGLEKSLGISARDASTHIHDLVPSLTYMLVRHLTTAASRAGGTGLVAMIVSLLGLPCSSSGPTVQQLKMARWLQGGSKVEEAASIFQELGDKFNWTVRSMWCLSMMTTPGTDCHILCQFLIGLLLGNYYLLEGFVRGIVYKTESTSDDIVSWQRTGALQALSRGAAVQQISFSRFFWILA